MTRPRSQLVSLEATPYYHCIARCVRRAFLCGKDRYTGKSFEHRKPWLVARLKLLTEVFAVDVAAYAVMSNHYHVVLHVDAARAASLSDIQVVRRWTQLYKGPELIQQYKAGKSLSETEAVLVRKLVQCWRERLANISWFMRCLNEYLARRANAEDKCKGRFWEARFKSQALLDEAALLSCMAYVDLNPVRAGIATDLVGSDFTSIQDRIKQVQSKTRSAARHKAKSEPRPRLMSFAEFHHNSQTYAVLPYNLKDYLALVDWTGRAIRPDKKGHNTQDRPSLLAVLGLSEAQWRILALEVQKEAITMLHGLDKLAAIERSRAGSKAA